MTDLRDNRPATTQSLREVAQEEFWIVAKSFFAPVYGPIVLFRQLLQLTRAVDGKYRQSIATEDDKACLSPAE